MAMVIPSWKGMQESSQQMKKVLEPTIKDKKDELAAVQRKVMWDLSELLKSSMEKVLKDMEAMLKEIADLLKPKMEQGLAELRKIFIKKVDEVIEKAKNTNEIEASLPSFFLTLDKAPRSWSVLYDALVHIRFVSTLHEKFRERINNLNGYLVTDIGTDKLAQFLDSAVFTFEERFNEGISGTDAKANGETAADVMKVVKEEVLLKYDEDQKIVLDQYLMESMLCMLVPHTHSLTDEVCKLMIKPVESSIPDPLRQAISLSDKYDTYVETSIRETIKKVCGIGGAALGKTEPPKADEPKADEPKADEPKADEPKADEPKADELKADEPKADELKADEPKADEPKVDEPKADEPEVAEPKADEPKADELKADEPKADEPKADEQTAEEKPSEAGEKASEPEAVAEEKKCEETTEL